MVLNFSRFEIPWRVLITGSLIIWLKSWKWRKIRIERRNWYNFKAYQIRYVIEIAFPIVFYNF